MGILRTYAVVFIAGWVLWLWMDKAGPIGPQQPIAPPYGGAHRAPYGPYAGASDRGLAPPAEGDRIQELQYSVDLLKGGRYRQGFVYLWRRQSWIVAGVITALLVLVGPGIRRVLGRRRGRLGLRSRNDPADHP
jgi:hypothetical protein